MKYKMIVSDFDGTIYRSDYTISDRTKAAMAEYVAAGGKMVIATGRLFQAVQSHAKYLGLKGEVITYQGSGVYDIDSGESLYNKDIPSAMGRQALTFMYDNGTVECTPMLFYDDKCYIDFEDEHTRAFADIVMIQPTYVGARLDQWVESEDIVPRKLLALVSPHDTTVLIALLRKNFGEMFNINQSAPSLVEMVNNEASKGNAVAWLAEKYGIKREEIICIGDAENDNSMLQFAGLGVAMGNAMDITKEVADIVGDTNDNDGVAKIIEQYGAMKG